MPLKADMRYVASTPSLSAERTDVMFCRRIDDGIDYRTREVRASAEQFDDDPAEL